MLEISEAEKGRPVEKGQPSGKTGKARQTGELEARQTQSQGVGGHRRLWWHMRGCGCFPILTHLGLSHLCLVNDITSAVLPSKGQDRAFS